MAPTEGAAGELIGDDEKLWRRVPSQRMKDERDEDGRPKLASDTMRDSAKHAGASVNRASLTGEPLDLLRLGGPSVDNRWGVVEIAASDVRVESLDVVAAPEPGNPGHAMIVPMPTSGQSKQCCWILPPGSAATRRLAGPDT